MAQYPLISDVRLSRKLNHVPMVSLNRVIPDIEAIVRRRGSWDNLSKYRLLVNCTSEWQAVEMCLLLLQS